MANLISVEIAYATPEKQRILTIQIEEGATIEEAITRSGIMTIFPEINLAKQKVGIFSKQKALTHLVQEQDRIEIYRPLEMDPKEARRKRAGKED